MSDRYDSWTEIILPREGAKEILRSLLGLASSVSEVRTQGNGDSVLVPADLADAYHASITPKKPRPRRAAKKEGDG